MSDPIPTQHIVLDDHGRAHIYGSRIRVAELISIKNAYGWDTDELARQYPHLSLGKVHAALSYYYDHKAAIDQENERLDREYEEHRRNAPETPLHRRVRELRSRRRAEENLGR